MGAQGQLNLWADRKLVARIIESIPSNGKDYSSLKCPRQRPDITQHSKFPSYSAEIMPRTNGCQ